MVAVPPAADGVACCARVMVAKAVTRSKSGIILREELPMNVLPKITAKLLGTIADQDMPRLRFL